MEQAELAPEQQQPDPVRKQARYARVAGNDQVELNPSVLAAVENGTHGIRPVESEAYYEVLARARDASYAAQKAAAHRAFERHQQEFEAKQQQQARRRKFSLIVELFQNPDDYSGDLVTLRGYVRKLISYPADENEFGVKTLYEAWLYTDESQMHPCVVVCSTVPEGMPQGGDLVEQAEITGYFFKMYVYKARDGTRRAPLFLAQTLEWSPRVEPLAGPVALYWYLAVLAGCGAVVALFWRVSRRRPSRPIVRGEAAETLDLTKLQDLAQDGEP